MRWTAATHSILIPLALWAASVAAADRDGNWEATIQIVSTGSESAQGDGGSSIDFSRATGWAFGIAYNLNAHLSVGFDGSFVKPKYNALIVPEDDAPFSIRHKASVFNGAVNGTWNFLQGNFTPYAQFGLGWTHLDSNVVDGPPSTGCWWDPWWGYVCAEFFSTFKDSRFSWNAGAGLRYELQNNLFVKGSFNRVFLDSAQKTADPRFDLWKLELGWMLR